MKLSSLLYDEVKDIWDGYRNHPFVREIGEGTLPLDKFRYFMVQDYLYLLDYAKVFALGVVKAKDETLMRRFADLVYGTLNGEMKLHKSYMKRLGITDEEIRTAKPSLSNTSYTNYMLWVGNNEGILELLVSILACSWSYKKIGDFLAENPESLGHEFYGEWVESYSSEEYAQGNEEILSLVDTLGRNISEKQLENLKTIFINCSQYEAMFWDMAYRKEM